MPIEKVLLVEDDATLCRSLEHQLSGCGYEVAAAGSLGAARELLARDAFDVVIADVRLPDGEGTDLLDYFQNRPNRPLLIMVSGYGSVEAAMECMKRGAFDYLLKPFTPEQVEVCLCKAAEHAQLVKVNRFLSHSGVEDASELIGQSEAMQKVRELIRKVGRTDATVLIQGESGTGKELVARELFQQSLRSGAPYIRVNCAAVPENLIESEFFGHEKGAFTGAVTRREGRFELAHGGTILLDEVSEVSPSVQAKLLRVLQEHELERVGGSKTLKVDVRVIATTNRNLEESIARKEFREDLFFRLNVVPIHIPALRERMEDVPLLAARFIERSARRLGIPVPSIGEDCLEAVMAHSWPGNIRELQNVLQRAVIFAAGAETLTAEHLALTGGSAGGHGPMASVDLKQRGAFRPVGELENLPTLEQVEKDLIFAALQRCNNNRTHAARMIGISLRTLRNKLSLYRRAGYREAMLVHDGDETVSAAA
ncbi:MAG TPA: sigma-54-dependent Fis family transcriptional regulator [Verrucomicrobiales bacterium]|mgnify:CR=1 FL=1|nr:sigma-54-dependent Fis family transcriptional regulator [Verrucomicrobiales bacterium]